MANSDEEAVVPSQPSESEVAFNLNDSFVAPWGLADEERPMHLLWDGPIEAVELRFAEPVELIEAYNIDGELADYTETEAHANGTEVQHVVFGEAEFTTPGYLSIKFRVPTIYEEAMVGQQVRVTFQLPDGTTHDFEEYTFTIRPQIEVVDAPDTVTLDDENGVDPINLTMRYIGFGMAQVKVEAEGAGELISKGESLYHDIAGAMIAAGVHKTESEHLEEVPEDWRQDAGVEIPEETLEDIVQGIRDLLAEGTALDEFDEEEIHQLADVIEEGEDQHEITPMYEHIEMLLLDSILDVVDRHPTENVQLSNPNTKVQIESRMHGILVRYRLSDNHGNEYDPIEIPVDVEDTRENGGVVETEINTEWEQHQLDPDDVLAEIMEEI